MDARSRRNARWRRAGRSLPARPTPKQSLDALREQNRRFDAAIKGMSHGLCMVDADERVIVCNAIYLGMFGLDPDFVRPGIPFIDVLRHSVAIGVATQTLEELHAVRKAVIAAGHDAVYHEELADGRLIAISHRPMPAGEDRAHTPHGHNGWVSTYEDVTRQRRAEVALQEQNRRFDAALRNMGQGLCMFDENGRVVVFNDRVLELFGLPNGTLRAGQTYRQVIEAASALGVYADTVGVDAICAATRAQLLAMSSGSAPQPPLVRVLADGRALAVLNRPMAGGGWVTTFEDVTERRRSEARIVHMASHDALTNLPNRTTFQERLERAVAGAAHGDLIAVFYIDLDGFKAINDTLGHIAGDRLLTTVAGRLLACVRKADTVARLGGDEFAIVLSRVVEPGDAGLLAARLLQRVGQSLRLNDQDVRPAMSIGIALARGAGTHADTLMRRADIALYRAKADGGHTYRYFEPAMEERPQTRRRHEADLRDNLRAGGFEPFYKPAIDGRSSAVTGFEALVR